MPNGDRPGKEDSDLHLTWQERELLKELVQLELTRLAFSTWPIGSARLFEWRCGKLEDIRAKLHIAKGA